MPLFDNETTTENEDLTPDIPVVEEEQVIEEEKNLPEVNLIVEDGSGISDSNSYCDLDFALEYCVNHGYTSCQVGSRWGTGCPECTGRYHGCWRNQAG